MVSLLVPTLNVSETESMVLQALLFVALLYFVVATISILYNGIPTIPWYWWPMETVQISITDDIGDLLPSERDNNIERLGRFRTVATFRSDSQFSLGAALDEYHSDSISYANALAEIGKELCEVTYQKDASEYRALLAKDRLRQQRYYHMIDGTDGTFTLMSLRELFMPWQAVRLFDRPHRFFRDHVTSLGSRPLRLVGWVLGLVGQLETAKKPNTVKWIKEFKKFRKNVNKLCRAVGSEIDDFPTLQETIQRLKRYAADGQQRISPFIAENALLRNTIEKNKRVITALRIRHTIEKLVGELPRDHYRGPNASPKWRKFWLDMWRDAATNTQNPFHKIFTKATGHYDNKALVKRGGQLYADMSSEIHSNAGMELNYEHFDFWTNEIAKVLVPKDDLRTGTVNWKREIRKYPVDGLPAYDPAVMDDDDDIIEGPPTAEPPPA